MRFVETDQFGVYVAPMSIMLVAAWVATIRLCRFAARYGPPRHVWHPALFIFWVYLIVLLSIVLAVRR